MNSPTTLCRITTVVDSGILSAVGTEALAVQTGIKNFNSAQGSCQMLKERSGIMLLMGSDVTLISQPVELLTTLVPPAYEDATLSALSRIFRLDIPGRGSIWSESVEQYAPEGLFTPESIAGTGDTAMQNELTGICCIVQRGKGEAIARVAIENGASVPTITYGQGTGLRDKLGLLRITIPADKEIINVIVSTYDGESVLNGMIDAGKLDLPGRGFIHVYPVRKGLINTRVNLSKTRHAASMEQIIGAVDELKNGIQWRSKGMTQQQANSKKRIFLNQLIDLTLMCDEGRGSDCVKAAMAVGAAGATISRCKYQSFGQTAGTISGGQPISPARESCSMVIGEKNVEQIVSALSNAGCFDNATHGRILVRTVPKACTYLGK